jgi:tetratricopeptide (TPR) repeat protein
MEAGDRLLTIADARIVKPADVARSEILLEPGRQVDVVATRRGATVTLKLTPAERGPATPKDHDALVLAANRSFARGRLSDAEKAYQAIVGTHKDCSEAWNNLALVHQVEGRPDAAVSAYRQAIRLDSANALYHYNLGICFSQIGNLQRSRGELSAAVDRDSKLAGARLMLGRISALSGGFDLAAQQALALRADAATEATGDFLTGEILRLQGDLNASEPWYLRAATRDAHYADPATALGAVYYDQGKPDLAKEWVDRALSLDPSSLRALNRLGLILTRTGDLDGAEQALKAAVRLHPDSGIAVANLGRVYLIRGDVRRAVSTFRHSVQLAPDATLSHVLLAMGLERAGRFAEAKKAYATALRLDPTYQEGYQRLAALHRRLGEVNLAESVLSRARRYGL